MATTAVADKEEIQKVWEEFKKGHLQQGSPEPVDGALPTTCQIQWRANLATAS